MFSHTGKVNAALLIALFLAVLLTAPIFSVWPGRAKCTRPSSPIVLGFAVLLG